MSHLNPPQLAAANTLSPDSRVWVYVAARPLAAGEKQHAQQRLATFCQQWTAHNQQLKAAAEVWGDQFILLLVDETQAGASGCSIDKSVHMMEQLGQELGTDLFDRMRFGWVDESGTLHNNTRDEVADLRQKGHITPETLMVNSLVQSKRDLQDKWLIPYGQSWHKRIIE